MIFIDAVNVKIRDGNVANRPIYIALAVTVEGTRDILGLWAGIEDFGRDLFDDLFCAAEDRCLSEVAGKGVSGQVIADERRHQRSGLQGRRVTAHFFAGVVRHVDFAGEFVEGHGDVEVIEVSDRLGRDHGGRAAEAAL